MFQFRILNLGLRVFPSQARDGGGESNERSTI